MHTSPKLHLLIVEDDIGDFRRLRSALREHNPERYIVRHASSVDQALRTLFEERFAVILLDISQPDIAVDDQIAVVRRAAPDALILALGTEWDAELARRAIGAGAQDFLLKNDLVQGRLVHAIDVAIARHEADAGDKVEDGLLQALLDEVSELAIVVDAAGFLKSGHEKLYRALGHRPADPHFRTWMHLLHPDDQNSARQTWNALVRDAGATETLTVRLPRSGGEWHEHRLRLSNRLSDPAIEGVVITGPDVSQAATQQAMFKRLAEVPRTFLGTSDREAAIHATLAMIGAAFEADDVWLVQYDRATPGGARGVRQLADWGRSEVNRPRGVPAHIERALLDPDTIGRLHHAAQFNPASGMVQTAPRRVGVADNGQGGALVCVPIFAQGLLWGGVALLSQTNIIDWPEERRMSLKSLADAVGLAALTPAPVELEEQSPDRTLQILDSVGTGVVLYGRGDKLLHANQAATAITGLKPEQLLVRFKPHIESGHGPGTDQSIKRADGSQVFVRIEVMQLTDPEGASDGGVITIRDMTSLYRAQRLVQTGQARLQAVTSTVDVGLLALDDRGRIESLNPAAEELLGIRGAAAAGHTLASLLPSVAAEAGGPLLHEYLERLGAGDAGQDRKMVAVRKDGALFPVAVTVGRYSIQNQSKYIVSVRDAGEDRPSDDRVALQLQQLEALHRIDRVLSSTRDQQVILDVVADQVYMMPDVDVAIIRTFDAVSRQLDLKATRGLPPNMRATPYLLLGQGTVGRSAVDRRALKLLSLQETLASDGGDSGSTWLQIGDGLVVPLIANSQLRGTLEVYRLDMAGISEQTVSFLNQIAAQAALAVEDTNMVAELERSKQLLEGAYETTLEGWSRALELRGVDTEGHSRRVTELAVQLGRALGLRDRDLLALRRGALLHDIGKIAVPDSVLHKPGQLDDEDWAMIRRIPHHAMNMLEGNTFLREASVVPFFHNERWDGSGYPNGLTGETIPLTARIFAVVDVWDTLISDRPYRKALPRAQAIEQMEALAGSSFDPAIVKTFLELVGDETPIGASEGPEPAQPVDPDFIDLDEELDAELQARIIS